MCRQERAHREGKGSVEVEQLQRSGTKVNMHLRLGASAATTVDWS